MERISQISTLNQLPQVSSQAEITTEVRPSAYEALPVDQRRSLGELFDRWRLNQGWNPWDNETQRLAIASWAHSLDKAGIPFAAYSELYERVIASRAAALNAGRQVTGFGVELLIAEWLGPHGLKIEMHQREVDRARTLPESAESQCERCFGTGMETITMPNGQTAVRQGCQHGSYIYPE